MDRYGYDECCINTMAGMGSKRHYWKVLTANFGTTIPGKSWSEHQNAKNIKIQHISSSLYLNVLQ